ncbi:MAG: RES family NAD+ phosphorylase [Kordiimonadaceae bacterium]|nr:RES family NAD+ phosphorylase [Kordiimonadaceae bacterium]
MWIHLELKSKITEFTAQVWRIVESQSQSSTLKITDSLDDQQILEKLLEETKPVLPEIANGFHYLISTPFRYKPYPHGSRFRKAGQPEGAYYASLSPETAIAEMAFYRMLFYSHSPDAILPENGAEYTAFQVGVKTPYALDLTEEPFVAMLELLLKEDYHACQELADAARAAGVQAIISQSVRCPKKGDNITVFDMKAFTSKEPKKTQTWRLHPSRDKVIALREFPRLSLEYRADNFNDPRISQK